MLNIELISISGRSAGTIARISSGYWMIGRHAECQIRPRSSSVSERHCLLHNTDKVLGIFDLNSQSGTFVNEHKLVPNTWLKLNDGDRIRLGKVNFVVTIKMAAQVVATAGSSDSADVVLSDAASVALDTDLAEEVVSASGGTIEPETGWQDKDIAELLEIEDEVDRENRYDEIRGKSPASRNEAVDIFEEHEVESDAELTDTMVDDRDDTPVEPIKPKRSDGSKQKFKKPKSPKSGRKLLSSFSMSGGDRTDNIKLVGAVLLVLSFGGFLAYQVIGQASRPGIELREGLD